MTPERKAELLTRKSVYAGRTISLDLERIVLPGGITTELEMIRHPGASCVLPLREDGSMVLIRQFRHAVGGDLLEAPAGKLDRGEAPEACAARELEEEVGLVAESLEPLGVIVTTPGFCDERIHLFLGTGLRPGREKREETELMTVEHHSVEDVVAMVADGTITDAKTVAVVSRARLRGLI